MTKSEVTYTVKWQRNDGTWKRTESRWDDETEAVEFFQWLFKGRAVKPACRIIEITSTERILPNRKRATPQQAKEG